MFSGVAGADVTCILTLPEELTGCLLVLDRTVTAGDTLTDDDNAREGTQRLPTADEAGEDIGRVALAVQQDLIQLGMEGAVQRC